MQHLQESLHHLNFPFLHCLLFHTILYFPEPKVYFFCYLHEFLWTTSYTVNLVKGCTSFSSILKFLLTKRTFSKEERIFCHKLCFTSSLLFYFKQLSLVENGSQTGQDKAWPQDYKTCFMLNSAEHEIFPAHKC